MTISLIDSEHYRESVLAGVRAQVCVCVCVCVNPGRWTIGKNTEIFQLIEIFSSVRSNLSWKDLHSSLSFNFFTWFYYSISFHFSLLLILLCPSLPFSFISSRSYILNSIVNVIFFFFFNYFWNSNLVSANESRSYYRVYTSAAYSFWKVEPIYFWKECEREHVQAHETYSSTVWISYILYLSLSSTFRWSLFPENAYTLSKLYHIIPNM